MAGTRRVIYSAQWAEEVPLDERIAVGDVVDVRGRQLMVHSVVADRWDNPAEVVLVYASDRPAPGDPQQPGPPPAGDPA